MSLIFDVKRFALNDGPGIRTTIFMKGCPLHCVWCHNPEGIDPRPAKLYTRKKCIGCQSCVDVCPEHNLTLTPHGIADGGRCTACGACAAECPTLAMQMAGREYGMDELMAIVEKERTVMEQSGGGVTVCGGEPLMHHDYLMQLLKELGRRGFHRTVDTTLLASADHVKQMARECELCLVDLKHFDPAAHRTYTGVSNEQILSNIQLLSQLRHPFWIRIPLIVGVNADDANLTASARFIAALPYRPEVVNLLIYHDIGKGKHERLGSQYNPAGLDMSAPTEADQHRAIDIFRAEGLEVKIGG